MFMAIKRYKTYPKSFLKKFSFYLFAILITAFLAALIFLDTKREVTIIITSAILIIYIFANIRFFKAEIEGSQVYFPKDKIKFDENDTNFYYYKSNVTDFGDELETPYFVFSKNNIKEAKIVSDMNILKNSEDVFPEMFYATKKDKTICIDFKTPLEFQQYDEDENLSIDESIKKVEKIYISVIKTEEFLKEIKTK